jgi:hypothetical protein
VGNFSIRARKSFVLAENNEFVSQKVMKTTPCTRMTQGRNFLKNAEIMRCNVIAPLDAKMIVNEKKLQALT